MVDAAGDGENKMQHFEYYKRLGGTALSFTLFGAGGLLIWCCYPILWLLPLRHSQKQLIGRYIIHYSFKAFVEMMRLFGVMSYEIKHQERLHRQGLFIVANHPSLIDVVLLLSILPDANCVVRRGLIQNIFTRGPLKTAQYIVNGEPQQLLQDCVACLQQKQNLLIFPEGTRSVRGTPLHFKKGAANIALMAQKPFTPVVISCNVAVLQKGVKWYHIPAVRPHFCIRIGKDLFLPPAQAQLQPAIATRRINAQLCDYFSEQLSEQHPRHY